MARLIVRNGPTSIAFINLIIPQHYELICGASFSIDQCHGWRWLLAGSDLGYYSHGELGLESDKETEGT
jgi:hypothetical protein